MKRIWMAALVVLWLSVEALAQFEVPRHVFRMGQLDEAKKVAQKKKAYITFVYSNKDSH